MKIKELTEQAGFVVGVSANADRQINCFAELVAAAEREACAKLCEARAHDWGSSALMDCATAIRARRQA